MSKRTNNVTHSMAAGPNDAIMLTPSSFFKGGNISGLIAQAYAATAEVS